MSEPDDLYKELERLRGGRGIERPDLGAHLGPLVQHLCGAVASDSGTQLRARVVTLLDTLIERLPPDHREVTQVAYAMHKDYRFPTLDIRIKRLAYDRNVSERTTRRMLYLAARMMVHEAQARADRPETSAGPGWRATSLTTLFRMDTIGPELYEMRRIVATQKIDQITIRLGLPPAPAPEDDVTVEALFGARVATAERGPDRSHLRIVLDLPCPLPAGAAHEFWLRVVLPPDQPTWSHCAIVPLNPCDSGTVRVRFAPDQPPAAVWLLDEVPYLDLRDPAPGSDRIGLDSHGEAERHFHGLREGYGYGIAWSPAPPPHAPI